MKQRIQKLTITIVTAFALATSVHAQGIPTIDAASIAQQLQQVIHMKEQIENQMSQIVELKNQVQALTSVDNLKGMAENLASQNIPDSWKDLYKDIQNVSDIDIEKILSQKSYDPKSSSQLLVGYYQQLEENFGEITERFNRLTNLQNRLRSAPDIKAAQDIQNQINVENGSIQIAQTKLDNMQRLYEVQKEVFQEQKKRQTYCGFQKRAGNTVPGCQ